MPAVAATLRGADQPIVDDEPAQQVAVVDASTKGTPRRGIVRRARRAMVRRDHRLAPRGARRGREVAGVARVAGGEVEERERDLFGHRLQVLVRIAERLDGPVDLGLRIVLEREPRREIGTR